MTLTLLAIVGLLLLLAYIVGRLCDRVREIQEHLGLPVGIPGKSRPTSSPSVPLPRPPAP